MFQRQNGKLTVYRVTDGISHLRAHIGAFVPMVEGENSPMMEFLDAVAGLEPGLVELRETLDTRWPIARSSAALSIEP
jgi:hypothetical protein